MSSSTEKEKKEHDKGSKNNEQHSISSLTATYKEFEGSVNTFSNITHTLTHGRYTHTHTRTVILTYVEFVHMISLKIYMLS